MRAGRGAWVVAIAVVVTAATAAVSGCGSCDVECGAPPDDAPGAEPVEATVVAIDDEGVPGSAAAGIATMRTDGGEIDVAVFGRVAALDVGATYLVPLSEGGDGRLAASLPAPCDCGGPYITDLDGEVVDTAYLASIRSIAFMRAGAALVGIGIVAIAVWALLRRRRGLPL